MDIGQFLIALSAFLGFLIFFCCLLFFISFSVHKSMTSEYSEIWGYGTFDRFKKEFESRVWRQDTMFKGSYFGERNDYRMGTGSQIHADIIRFDGKGMVLRHIHYFRYLMYMRSKMPPRVNRKKLWQ